MRITNKVMQNNALVNINKNKELQDSLNTQIATGKKIAKPSEDPVVAIRALRLRSDVSQVTQYFKKNVPDATSWLSLTESAIKTTVSVVTDMVEQCEKGATDTLKTEDRKTIIDSLSELRKEVYATGDADYAGRYIFTGYRTDTSLSFGEQTSQQFNITQMISAGEIEQQSYVDVQNLLNLSETAFSTGTNAAITEQDVESMSYYRMRLAYYNLDATQAPTNLTIDGTNHAITVATDADSAYHQAASDPDSVILIPSTGELLLGANVYADAKNSTTDLAVSYSKTEWQADDLRPQHYFYATTNDARGNAIEYNPDYLTTGTTGQAIEYQIGFDQSIQVNTYAEDIYQHAIGRDIDEIIDLANKLTEVEDMTAKLTSMSEDTVNYTDAERETIKTDLDAANKAQTLLKDQLQKRFSNYITKMQSYLSVTNEALTIVGNRTSRVALVSNRLSDQTTTFKTLQSENEDADETEVAVQLSSAKVSYEAALMATSQMIDTTLLNYL